MTILTFKGRTVPLYIMTTDGSRDNTLSVQKQDSYWKLVRCTGVSCEKCPLDPSFLSYTGNCSNRLSYLLNLPLQKPKELS